MTALESHQFTSISPCCNELSPQKAWLTTSGSHLSVLHSWDCWDFNAPTLVDPQVHRCRVRNGAGPFLSFPQHVCGSAKHSTVLPIQGCLLLSDLEYFKLGFWVGVKYLFPWIVSILSFPFSPHKDFPWLGLKFLKDRAWSYLAW